MNCDWIRVDVGYAADDLSVAAPTVDPTGEFLKVFDATKADRWLSPGRTTITPPGLSDPPDSWVAAVLESELNRALLPNGPRLRIDGYADRCVTTLASPPSGGGRLARAGARFSGRPGVICRYGRPWIDQLTFRVRSEDGKGNIVDWIPTFLPSGYFMIATLVYECPLATGP